VAAIATGLVAGVVRLDQTSFRDWARGIGIVVVIVLTISVQRFRGYAQAPSAADAFRTKAVCRWTWAIFFLLPLIGIGIYAAILDVLPQ
jgi:hypothetical protein